MKTVVDTLHDLIRIPSVSSVSNRSVIEYAQQVFQQAGWKIDLTTYVDAHGVEKMNLIAAPPEQDPDGAAVDLAFLCHTDTVPPAADWTAALEPFVDAGNLYGCGACDVKGFLACLLTAVSETQDAPFQKELRIVLTADEEIGCLGSHRLLAENKLLPRSLVIGEPTSLHAARAGKGYCLGEVAISGAEAHSAHPQQGRSAIYGAAKVILAIEQFAEQLAQESHPFFDPPYTTINIGTISGGTAKNIIPAECRFLVEWRPIPGRSAGEVPDQITQILVGMRHADSAFRGEFKILRQQQGFETPCDSELVRSIQHFTGRAPIAIPFGSEASVFASLAEEIVVFGPGDMRTAHSPREYVPILELEEAVRCVKSLMQE